METIRVVDYTRYPAGEKKSDGPYSGQWFAEDVLLPALRRAHSVLVVLDGTEGYGSSFLRGAFEPIGEAGYKLGDDLKIESRDTSLIVEIAEYMGERISD